MFWLNTIFVWFESLHIFNEITLILHHSHSLFSYSIIYILKSIWDPQSYIETKVREKQWKPVLLFVLFYVVKEILCNSYPLVSIHLRLLNCCTQLESYGCLDIQWRFWLWLICDINLWIITGVGSNEYLLVIDTVFIIQREHKTDPEVRCHPDIDRKKMDHWKGLG